MPCTIAWTLNNVVLVRFHCTILFLIFVFVNDLPEVMYHMFADNAKLYPPINTPQHHAPSLQQALLLPSEMGG